MSERPAGPFGKPAPSCAQETFVGLNPNPKLWQEHYCFVLGLQIFCEIKASCKPNQSLAELTLLIASFRPLTDLPALGILDPTEVIFTFS